MRWQGRVEAWGVWIPPDACNPESLLHWWCEGCRLLQAHHGWLLVFGSSQSLVAETLPVVPVVKISDGWGSFPSAQPKSGEFVLKWQGAIWSNLLTALAAVDLASLWLDDSLDYSEAQPFAKVLSRPRLVKRPQKAAIREVFRVVPEAAPEQKEWMRRLSLPKQRTESSNPLLGFFDLLSSFFESKSNQKYVSKMMELFEKEQWHDALRHAIPLDQDESQLETLKRFLGALKPRSSLDFTPKGTSGHLISTSLAGLDVLHRLYEDSFTKLAQSGRLEEAAFVKAELLGDVQGAVEFLEEHKLFQSAANLATLKGLPAAQQVRLWFRAGRIEQALGLARCHRVHAAAVLELERRDREQALKFRVVWAQDLAKMGHFSEAVQAGWAARSDLPDYRDWIEQSLLGEDSGASHTMALALGDPELSRELGLGLRLQKWFADTDPFGMSRRRDFLDKLVRFKRSSPNPEVQRWAGLAARQVMRQANSPWELGDRKILKYLADLSGDRWLKVDIPRSLPKRRMSLDHWHQIVDSKGHLPIYDASGVGDGRILVALGHTGLALVSKNGAISQKFDLPTHVLICPRRSSLFLTFSEGRIGSFQHGKAQSHCSVNIDGFADQHDGLCWFVWFGSQVFRMDIATLLAPDKESWLALSRLNLQTYPEKLSVGPKTVAILTKHTVHYYSNPGLTPRDSRPTGSPDLLTPQNEQGLNYSHGQLRYQRIKLAIQPHLMNGESLDVDFQSPYGIITVQTSDRLVLCIFDLSSPEQQMVLELPGAKFATVRAMDREIVISDSCGRLLIADPASQSWLGQFFL
jgi:hypothetical protein